jgi:hypothetical protein
MKEFQGGCFYFPFRFDKAFPAVFAVHWGQQQNAQQVKKTRGTTHTAAGAGKPRDVVFFITATRIVAQG